MKTKSFFTSLAVGSALFLTTGVLHADVSAPDNVLYGILVLGSKPVTAENIGVSVEAKRSNGLPVARYVMGSLPEAGNFYMLAIKVEEVAPRVDPGSVLIGEPLTIVVSSNNIPQAQQTFVVTERGQVTRLDFGSVPLTGFEAWAMTRGLDIDSQQLDWDRDDIPNFAEYIAGTDPNQPASKFLLRVARTLTQTQVSFDALRATGTGYEGLNRHYALEQSASLRPGSWSAVPGFSDIIGADQIVSYSTIAAGPPLMFRGRVWLAAQSSSQDLRLLVGRNAGQMVISFLALGPDNQGRNRYYTLEHSSNLESATWSAVVGYTNILGAGQTVTYSVPAATGRGFYRGRLELRNP